MVARIVTIALFWALVLATAWVVEPYAVAVWASATSPRAVTPRGNLSAAEETAIAVFKNASPSVVHVFAVQRPQASALAPREGTVLQTGSGIVWDAAGHVITNFHVINGTDRIGARLTSGEFVGARVVGTAANYDLAVLQLERPHSLLHPIAVGKSANLQVGQMAFAIGNPYGLDLTLTSGIISALHRRLPTTTPYEIEGVIQTDAPINPGNSGGPLLDDAGRLIGVNSALVSSSGAFAGIGFAIPVDVVNRIAPSLIREGSVPMPGIGIAAAPEEAAADAGIDGVVIVKTVPGSPAAKAGLVGMDANNGNIADVITTADGEPVHSLSDLAGVFEKVGVGHKVDLTVMRGDNSRTVEVTVTDISKLEAG